jgi:hypothetical protein
MSRQNQRTSARPATLILATALVSAFSGAAPAHAAPIIDAPADFLSSYTGPRDPDLDVRLAEVIVDPKAGTVSLLGLLAGPIDKASGKFYVFGVDRGRGEVGRDLVFQGPLGGEPKIGAGVRWDAAVGLTATGQAVYFDALNPGVVPLPDVKVSVNGSEISATVPLALFPSQGLKFKDYTYNFWPRSTVSLANTVLSDFAPDNSDAPVSIAGKDLHFNLVRSGRVEACLAAASGDVTVRSLDGVEVMEVALQGLPPDSDFALFLLQQPNAPFGLGTYQGDVRTNSAGRGAQRFIGRFSATSFSVAPGAAAAPVLHHEAFPDAQLGPATGPVHQLHLGLWFNSPADAAKAGCPGDVTPFNGTHNAGIQVLSTRNFPALQGPLLGILP